MNSRFFSLPEEKQQISNWLASGIDEVMGYGNKK